MKMKGKAFYTYIYKADDTYGQWKTTIVVDKAEKLRVEEACGLKFTRTDGDFEEHGDYLVNVRRYTEMRGKNKGKPNKQPILFINGERDQEETIVGNGSLVEVDFKPYSWTYGNRKGVSADFNKMNVLELIPYEPKETEEEEVEDTQDDLGDDEF